MCSEKKNILAFAVSRQADKLANHWLDNIHKHNYILKYKYQQNKAVYYNLLPQHVANIDIVMCHILSFSFFNKKLPLGIFFKSNPSKCYDNMKFAVEMLRIQGSCHFFRST